MRLSKRSRSYRTIREILGIPLEEPGPLLFQVLLNGKTVATHTVTIHEPGVLDEVSDLMTSR